MTEAKSSTPRLSADIRAQVERLAIRHEAAFEGMSFKEAGHLLAEQLSESTDGVFTCTDVQAIAVLKKYNIACVTEADAKANAVQELQQLRETNAQLIEDNKKLNVTVGILRAQLDAISEQMPAEKQAAPHHLQADAIE